MPGEVGSPRKEISDTSDLNIFSSFFKKRLLVENVVWDFIGVIFNYCTTAVQNNGHRLHGMNSGVLPRPGADFGKKDVSDHMFPVSNFSSTQTFFTH